MGKKGLGNNHTGWLWQWGTESDMVNRTNWNRLALRRWSPEVSFAPFIKQQGSRFWPATIKRDKTFHSGVTGHGRAIANMKHSNVESVID